MRVRSDHNNFPIYETRKIVPLQAIASISVPALGSNSVIVNIPSSEMWFIKSWTITKGSNVTVTSIKIDNADTYEVVNVTDTVARYGVVLNAEKSVTIAGSNSGLTDASLEIKISGYKMVF